MKIFLIFLSVCVCTLFNISPACNVVLANDNNLNFEQLEEELNNSVSTRLEEFDFSALDSYLAEIGSQLQDENTYSFSDVVKGVASGNYFNDFSDLYKFFINLFFSGVQHFMPTLFLIVAIALLGVMLNSLKSKQLNSGVSDVIHFVCFAVVVLLLVVCVRSLITLTEKTLTTMSEQMQIIFPILLTLLSSVGGVASVGLYKPVLIFLTQGMMFVFNKILFPLFGLSFLFLIVGNLSSSFKFDKFSNFLFSSFKWLVGFAFTVFASVITIQGISAGKFDGISVKATKFAVKSYIPIIGGYLSDGFDLLMSSGVIIKNAVGVVGLFLVMLTIVVPIVKILVFKFGLQLVSSILEIVGETKICNFTYGCSKILIYPIVVICAVAFMYVLSVGLIMTTANIV